MNDRIRELMGKTLDEKFSHTWTTLTYEELEIFAKHFADKVVRECIVITNDQYFAYEAVEKLQEHFGVER